MNGFWEELRRNERTNSSESIDQPPKSAGPKIEFPDIAVFSSSVKDFSTFLQMSRNLDGKTEKYVLPPPKKKSPSIIPPPIAGLSSSLKKFRIFWKNFVHPPNFGHVSGDRAYIRVGAGNFVSILTLIGAKPWKF